MDYHSKTPDTGMAELFDCKGSSKKSKSHDIPLNGIDMTIEKNMQPLP